MGLTKKRAKKGVLFFTDNVFSRQKNPLFHITRTHTLSHSLSHTHTYTHTHKLHLADYNFLHCEKNLLKNLPNEEKSGEEESFIEMSITHAIDKKV